MSGDSEQEILARILKYASAIDEDEKCGHVVTADMQLKVCPSDSKALQNIATKLKQVYDLSWPAEITTLGTIRQAANYIFQNKTQG
jgi:hypothetical protein